MLTTSTPPPRNRSPRSPAVAGFSYGEPFRVDRLWVWATNFFSEDAMNVIKLTLVAAALSLGLTASSVALPVDRLGALVQEHGVQADQVRTVCNQWGRCW